MEPDLKKFADEREALLEADIKTEIADASSHLQRAQTETDTTNGLVMKPARLHVQNSGDETDDGSGSETDRLEFIDEAMDLTVERSLRSQCPTESNNELIEPTSETPHKCFICDKEYGARWKLQRHLRDVHIRAQPYMCNVCGQRFQQNNSLADHIRTHTGEMPYVCHVCNKRFYQKGNLTKHERIHSGERPFKCGECDKAFSHSSNLVSHQRLHTGEFKYTCSVCNMRFNQLNNLDRHMRSHVGDLFKCTVCPKEFNSRGSLKRHKLRIHNVCDDELETINVSLIA